MWIFYHLVVPKTDMGAQLLGGKKRMKYQKALNLDNLLGRFLCCVIEENETYIMLSMLKYTNKLPQIQEQDVCIPFCIYK